MVVDAWEVLNVWTEGGTDTVGIVYDAGGNQIAYSESGGEGNNFGLQRALGPGTYFVEVAGNGDATGAYVVAMATSPVNDLAFGGQIYARIDPAFDVDRYRLTLDTPMIVSIWTESRLDTVGTLLDEDGSTIWWAREGGEGENFRIHKRVLAAGTYYIEVDVPWEATGEYFVKAEGEPVPDLVFEANSLTAAVEGELESADDRDWYRLTVTEPAMVSVFMSGTTNPIGGVNDADRNGLYSDCCNGEGGNLRWEDPLSPGTYYISVASSSTPGQTGTYDLSVVLEPANFANLAPGTPVAGEIGRAGERDLYRLSIDSISTVSICTEAEFWTRGRLRDADGRVIGSAASNGLTGPSYCIERSLAPGTYFVETHVDRFGYETGEYTLEADVEPLQPADLALGSEIADRISRPGDSAWFRLTVARPMAVTVWTAGDTDTRGRLLDGDGQVLAIDDDSGHSRNFSIERVLTPGTYYVEVSGDGSHAGLFTVFAAAEPVLELTLGTPYADQIDPAGDTDWFGLDLQAPAIVTVRTEGDTDSYGRLFHGNGDEIGFDDDSGQGSNFLIERVLPAGTYYIGVRGYNEDSTTGPYTIHTNAVRIPDADDVSTVTEVTPLPFRSRVAGQIGPSPGDRDYFRLSVEVPSIVTVRSEGDSNTRAWMFGEHQHRNAFDDDSGEGRNFRFERFLPAGTYTSTFRGRQASRPGISMSTF